MGLPPPAGGNTGGCWGTGETQHPLCLLLTDCGRLPGRGEKGQPRPGAEDREGPLLGPPVGSGGAGVSRGHCPANLPSPQGVALALPEPFPPSQAIPPLPRPPTPSLPGLPQGIRADPGPRLCAGSCSRPPAASPGRRGSCTGQRDPRVGFPSQGLPEGAAPCREGLSLPCLQALCRPLHAFPGDGGSWRRRQRESEQGRPSRGLQLQWRLSAGSCCAARHSSGTGLLTSWLLPPASA